MVHTGAQDDMPEEWELSDQCRLIPRLYVTWPPGSMDMMAMMGHKSQAIHVP